MKKYISLLLALVMSLSLFTGCAQQEKVSREDMIKRPDITVGEEWDAASLDPHAINDEISVRAAGHIYESLVKQDENLDIIYAGPQPPNPAEMLMSSHIDDLFKELRSRYDYIILDSVPAMAVADAMIIDRLVDLTVYVIREGHLDRRHLPEIEKLYREKKFHNLSTILNGVTTRKRAYGYGYTYGYGYFAENEQNSKWSNTTCICVCARIERCVLPA